MVDDGWHHVAIIKLAPGNFNGRQSDPELILCAVRWAQRYGPELAEPRRPLRPTHQSWRVDESAARVKGRWYYLYRALDASGATIDFLLSGVRDAATAARLFRTALTDTVPRRRRSADRAAVATAGRRITIYANQRVKEIKF